MQIDSDTDRFSAQVEFPVLELDKLLQNPSFPSKPTTLQLTEAQPSLTQIVLDALVIEVDGRRLALTYASQQVRVRNDGLYVRQLYQSNALPATANYLLLRYGLFGRDEGVARAFVKLVSRGVETTTIVDPRHPAQRLALREVPRLSAWFIYAREGTRHIWSGADHLLFLICLLLPGLALIPGTASASSSASAQRQALSRVGPFARYVLKVVTAFTIAHSITLAAAALDWIVLPEQWIEATIAATIVVSAVLNLIGVGHRRQWPLALGFGLIHGLGFANGLRELGLSTGRFVETLLAFNIGVEFGQLLLVIVAASIAVTLLTRLVSVERLQFWGSVAILCVASLWFVERLS